MPLVCAHLQHPKEKYHPLGSARIALLGLARVQVIVVPLGVGKLRLMPKQPGSKRSACGRVGRSRGLKPRPGLEGDATRVPVPAADMGSDSGPQAERNGVPQPCMGQEREEAGASEPSSRQESDRGLRPCAVAQEGNEQEGTEEERDGEGEEGEEEGDDFCPMFQTGSSTSSEDVELMRDGSALALDSLALALDSSALPPEGSAQSLDNVASAQEQAATAPSEALEGSLTQRSRGITFTPANTSRGGGADGFSNREPPHTRSHASDTSTSTCAIPRSPEVPGVFEGLRALRQGAGGNERAQFLQKRWFVLPDRTGDPSAVQQGLQEALGPSMEGERGCDPSGQDCLIPDWLHVPPGTALLYPSRDSRELPSLPRDSRQLATLASERLGAGTGDCDRGLWRGVSAGCEEGVGAERGENNDSREQESDGVGKGSTQQAHEHCEQATAGGSREEKDKARRGSTQIPSHLIVLDGTWPKAKRVYKQNPWLQHLPQYHLPPEAIKPSVYGPIRKEPKVSTFAPSLRGSASQDVQWTFTLG